MLNLKLKETRSHQKKINKQVHRLSYCPLGLRVQTIKKTKGKIIEKVIVYRFQKIVNDKYNHAM